MNRIVAILAVLGLIAAGGWFYVDRSGPVAPVVRTATVSRGPVVQIVQGTGTLGAVTTVTVGTQVSGVISWLGADFNSRVKKGQVIARLDPALLEAQVLQARASLTRAKADLQQRNVTLADRKTKFDRASKLSAGGLISATDLETAKLTWQLAASDLESGRASLVQAEASLNQAQVNLSRAVIAAPIDGIVIQRSVDVGQTVAASLSSPTLFLIAADLADMQVAAQIDETDVSRIAEGQAVAIRVDAYANETFAGVVSQIRLQPQVVSNVTTYATIIDVPNAELKLKPGMTADVKIEIARRDDVLRVPNTALRFRPTPEIFAMLGQAPPNGAAQKARPAVGGADRVALAMGSSGRERPITLGPTTRGEVWTQENGQLQAVPVTLGLADATYTEITQAPLTPGTVLVTAVTGASTTVSAPTPTNPFTQGGRGR